LSRAKNEAVITAQFRGAEVPQCFHPHVTRRRIVTTAQAGVELRFQIHTQLVFTSISAAIPPCIDKLSVVFSALPNRYRDSSSSWPDRLCGLVVRVLGYRSGGQGSIPGTTKKKVVGLERDPLSLVSTTEELLDRKVAAPV
jgi:hypothetical protein